MRDPRAVPGRAHGWFRRWFRTLFKIRGGGLYALGYILTFVWLEVTTLIDELFGADGVSDFVGRQVIELAFRFASDSIQNMVRAFIWPVPILQFHPPYGVFGLALLFIGFGRFIKPTLERWMFGDDAPAAGETTAQGPATKTPDANQVSQAGTEHDTGP